MKRTELGREIGKVRKREGWSLEETARKLGVSYATVSRWERGKTKRPSQLAVTRLMILLAEFSGAVKHNFRGDAPR